MQWTAQLLHCIDHMSRKKDYIQTYTNFIQKFDTA